MYMRKNNGAKWSIGIGGKQFAEFYTIASDKQKILLRRIPLYRSIQFCIKVKLFPLIIQFTLNNYPTNTLILTVCWIISKNLIFNTLNSFSYITKKIFFFFMV